MAMKISGPVVRLLVYIIIKGYLATVPGGTVSPVRGLGVGRLRGCLTTVP